MDPSQPAKNTRPFEIVDHLDISFDEPGQPYLVFQPATRRVFIEHYSGSFRPEVFMHCLYFHVGAPAGSLEDLIRENEGLVNALFDSVKDTSRRIVPIDYSAMMHALGVLCTKVNRDGGSSGGARWLGQGTLYREVRRQCQAAGSFEDHRTVLARFLRWCGNNPTLQAIEGNIIARFIEN